MKCLSCGADKDGSALEVYPYDGEFDHITQSKPIPPLMVIECDGDDEGRIAILCHDCWHRLGENTQGIDMWISDRCWATLNPVTPFRELPEPKNFDHLPEPEKYRAKWDAASYQQP